MLDVDEIIGIGCEYCAIRKKRKSVELEIQAWKVSRWKRRNHKEQGRNLYLWTKQRKRKGRCNVTKSIRDIMAARTTIRDIRAIRAL